MLDIGFAELLVVAAIALFVVGPERLPSTIRSLSLWLGRLKRSFEEIKSDVSRELHKTLRQPSSRHDVVLSKAFVLSKTSTSIIQCCHTKP